MSESSGLTVTHCSCSSSLLSFDQLIHLRRVPMSAVTNDSANSSTSSSSNDPSSPPSATSLPTLDVEFPADHPVARRASKLQAQKEAAAFPALGASSGNPLATPTKGDALAASLLEQFSTPLSMPNS